MLGLMDVPEKMESRELCFPSQGKACCTFITCLSAFGHKLAVIVFRPSVGCVEKRSSCTFGDVADALFGHTILVVCAHTTKCDCLVCSPHIINEGLVSEMAVVTMVVLDAYSMLLGHSFEGRLGFNGFFGCQVVVHVVASEITGMIHEHRGSTILLDHGLALGDGHKPWNGCFQFVNADHGPWYSGWLDLGTYLVCLPQISMSLTI